MKFQHQIDQLISRQASDWIEVLRTGGVKERSEFVAWLKESRRHVEEFLAMVAVDRELGHIDAGREHDLEALLEKISPVREIRALHRPNEQPKSRRGSRLLKWGLAAGFACLLSLWLMSVRSGQWQDYSTAVGEQRSVTLSDGSLVQLNTESSINVRLGDSARDIQLVRGEALFKVAHDSRRPFRVLTLDAMAQAVGTEFNVYAHDGVTTVSVLEGKVKVLATGTAAGGEVGDKEARFAEAPASAQPAEQNALGAGEQARVSEDGRIQRKIVKELDQVIAWRERRLVFREDTLEDITREFNRYNLTPKFRLDGDQVKQRHYSGNFDAGDPQSLAALLSREKDLTMETRGVEILIRSR